MHTHTSEPRRVQTYGSEPQSTLPYACPVMQSLGSGEVINHNRLNVSKDHARWPNVMGPNTKLVKGRRRIWAINVAHFYKKIYRKQGKPWNPPIWAKRPKPGKRAEIDPRTPPLGVPLKVHFTGDCVFVLSGHAGPKTPPPWNQAPRGYPPNSVKFDQISSFFRKSTNFRKTTKFRCLNGYFL